MRPPDRLSRIQPDKSRLWLSQSPGSAGEFGACLLAESVLVARCVEEMQRAVSIPVTVKTRIGVDERDSEQEFAQIP